MSNKGLATKYRNLSNLCYGLSAFYFLLALATSAGFIFGFIDANWLSIPINVVLYGLVFLWIKTARLNRSTYHTYNRLE